MMKGVFCLLITLMLSACNTMDGLNKDIKDGGDQVRKDAGPAAEQVRKGGVDVADQIRKVFKTE
jgi:predicted small secreted protein